MKKLVVLMVSITIFLASCSKEQKINKQLDGEWNITMMSGDAVAAGAATAKFDAGKKGEGTGSISMSDPLFGTFTFPLTYKIDGDNFTMTMSALGASDVSSNTIVEHSKTKFIIKDSDGELTEMTKK